MSVFDPVFVLLRRYGWRNKSAESDMKRVADFRKVFWNSAQEWGSSETKSGGGSTFRNTAVFRERLAALLVKYEICSILDCPCGDFHFMKEMDLRGIRYIGGDIIQELVESNCGSPRNPATP